VGLVAARLGRREVRLVVHGRLALVRGAQLGERRHELGAQRVVRLLDGEAGLLAELVEVLLLLGEDLGDLVVGVLLVLLGRAPRGRQRSGGRRGEEQRRRAVDSFSWCHRGFAQGRRSSSRHAPQNGHGTTARSRSSHGFSGAEPPAQARAAPINWTTSPSSGKRWSASFENRTLPFTVTSKAPPSDGTSFRLLIFLL